MEVTNWGNLKKVPLLGVVVIRPLRKAALKASDPVTMVLQVHFLHFGLWWQNCLNKSMYIFWFPLSCSRVHKVSSMPTTPAIAFKDAACSSCFNRFSHITVWRLQLCSLTNFFHHWLSQTNLHKLKIGRFFQNTLLWRKTCLLYDFQFPFGLTSWSHPSCFIFQWCICLQNLHFTVSGKSHLISIRKSLHWWKFFMRKAKAAPADVTEVHEN